MSLPWQVQPLVAGKAIVRRGDKPTRCFLLKDGFVSSAKSTNQGTDGITGIHIAGDMPDLFGLHLEIMDTEMRAATKCTVADVDHIASENCAPPIRVYTGRCGC
jgi:CRP-like cAMP-binding protein